MSYQAYKHVKFVLGNRLRKSFNHRWVGVKIVGKEKAVRPYIYLKNSRNKWLACRHRVSVENVEGVFSTLTKAVEATLGVKS